MIKKHNLKLTAMTLAVGTILLNGCGATTSAATNAGNTTTVVATENANSTTTSLEVTPAVTYEADDYYTKWENTSYKTIALGDTIKAQGSGMSVAKNIVTISAAGTYVISGKLEDGQIVVDTQDTGTVRLVFNGVELQSKQNAPIHVKSAEKVVISLEEGTHNIISDTTNYVFAEGEDEPNGAVFSKADLTINGTGTLTVNANYEDGIVSKDSLKIVEGNLVVNCVDDGVRGKDMVAIKNGNFTIQSGGDAIKSTNSSKADKGFILIEDGVFHITSSRDGIQAETSLHILKGDFNITTGGGSEYGKVHVDSSKGGAKTFNADGTLNQEGMVKGNRDQMGQRPTDLTEAELENLKMANHGEKPNAEGNGATTQTEVTTETEASTEEETVSTKAIKAETKLVIDGGTFVINAADDAIHSNGEVTINKGDFNIATGDDGIHGDTVVVINDGNINMNKCYEGIEGYDITINGGHTYIVSDDDGINAAGDSEAVEEGKKISLTLNGGELFITAHGDGLDSNGNMTINGGTAVVNALIGKGENALDYDGAFAVTGGTFATTGGASLSTSQSTQKVISMSFEAYQEANTIVCIHDSQNNVIAAFAPDRSFNSVYISAEKLDEDATYTLSYGGTITEEAVNGLYLAGSYTGGTKVTEFKLQEAMTYINEAGITTGPSLSQNSGGKGGMGRGQVTN